MQTQVKNVIRQTENLISNYMFVLVVKHCLMFMLKVYMSLTADECGNIRNKFVQKIYDLK